VGIRGQATDCNRELLTVIAFMRAARGKREELKAALAALIEPTKREDGYVDYDLH
jgi:quinol monooxygenase YgiN